jgi:hypothetical protein
VEYCECPVVLNSDVSLEECSNDNSDKCFRGSIPVCEDSIGGHNSRLTLDAVGECSVWDISSTLVSDWCLLFQATEHKFEFVRS